MGAAKFVAAWVMVVFVGVLAAIILWKVWKNDIDLKELIEESTGGASMSRFQFLVFTFVVVLMWIYLFFCNGCTGFPHIDSSVLALLGISGGSYVVSKGIQMSHDADVAKAQADRRG